jgi:hypothetical protein
MSVNTPLTQRLRESANDWQLDGLGIDGAREIASLLMEAAAELERARGADDKVANLATMVRRLARQLRIVLPSDQDHTLIGQAYGLLRKYGLQGSPLRDEYTEGEPAKPPEQPEKP